MFFTTLDSEQCFNVSITDDSECEYNEHCENEMFTCVLETEEGSRVMAVDPFISVYILDGDDCGMLYTHVYIPINDSINSIYDTVFLAERMNTSCTPPDVILNDFMIEPGAPNPMMTPSPTVTVMEDSSPKENSTTLIWVLVSVIGLVTFFAIGVAGITLFIICNKTKKQQLAELAKSRSELLLRSCCHFIHEVFHNITCSEENDFDVPTRYTSIG